MQSAKYIEEEIDVKMTEMKNLEKVHTQLEQYIISFEQAQRKYEELFNKRKEVLINLKKANHKIIKEK